MLTEQPHAGQQRDGTGNVEPGVRLIWPAGRAVELGTEADGAGRGCAVHGNQGVDGAGDAEAGECPTARKTESAAWDAAGKAGGENRGGGGRGAGAPGGETART